MATLQNQPCQARTEKTPTYVAKWESKFKKKRNSKQPSQLVFSSRLSIPIPFQDLTVQRWDTGLESLWRCPQSTRHPAMFLLLENPRLSRISWLSWVKLFGVCNHPIKMCFSICPISFRKIACPLTHRHSCNMLKRIPTWFVDHDFTWSFLPSGAWDLRIFVFQLLFWIDPKE